MGLNIKKSGKVKTEITMPFKVSDKEEHALQHTERKGKKPP